MPVDDKISVDLTTPTCILSYPNLDPEHPRINQLSDNPSPEWSADGLFDPRAQSYAMLCKSFEDIRQQFIDKYKVEPKYSPSFKVVGEYSNLEKTKPNAHHIVGLMRLSVRQAQDGPNGYEFPAPQLIGIDKGPVTFREFYGGCKVKLGLTVREYEYKKNGKVVSRGLTTDLKAVRFMDDGIPLGRGNRDYTDMFDDDPYGEDVDSGAETAKRTIA